MKSHSDAEYTFNGTLIQYLFRKIDDAYRGRFLKEFGTSISSAECTWADTLDDMGITPLEAKIALDCINRGETKSFRYLPTLPEFAQLCRPNIDYQLAFEEAVEQTRLRIDGRDGWSHPAIFWAAVEIGPWDLNRSNWNQIKTRWTEILRNKLATCSNKIIPKAQPDPKLEYKISSDEREKNKGRLKEALKGAIKEAA